MVTSDRRGPAAEISLLRMRPVLDTIEFIEFLRCAGLSKMGATQCTNLRFYRWGLALSHPTPTRINLDFVAIYARPIFPSIFHKISWPCRMLLRSCFADKSVFRVRMKPSENSDFSR
eukprot:COSAG01_NODE_36281_length_519_cov_12.166667_1_plen_116_part_10